jgi:hypothetical protein
MRLYSFKFRRQACTRLGSLVAPLLVGLVHRLRSHLPAKIEDGRYEGVGVSDLNGIEMESKVPLCNHPGVDDDLPVLLFDVDSVSGVWAVLTKKDLDKATSQVQPNLLE